MDMTLLIPAALSGLGSISLLALLTWVVATMYRDVSLVDSMWGIFIAAAALEYSLSLPRSDSRGIWMLLLATVWAVRLSVYITWRNWGHGEDRRYQEIRKRNQPNFPFKSLYLVFAVQAILAWLVSAPLLAGMESTSPLNWLDAVGIGLVTFGIVFETVGDLQMARFKADPNNTGQVMDRGLWRYTRHPNYFGECCVWWGFWLMALAGAGLAGVWTVLSPALMTVLLLKVSGVNLLEKDITERRPAYRDYIASTNAFVPGWPRSGGSVRKVADAVGQLHTDSSARPDPKTTFGKSR